LALCDVYLSPLVHKVDHFVPLPHGPLVPIGVKIGLFVFITDKQMDTQMNRQTGCEHYASACQCDLGPDSQKFLSLKISLRQT